MVDALLSVIIAGAVLLGNCQGSCGLSAPQGDQRGRRFRSVPAYRADEVAVGVIGDLD
jgi:hypothetical protein